MNRYKLIVAFLLMACSLCVYPRQKKGAENSPQPVYVFGFAASFTDSLAFVTGIQKLDSCYLTKSNKFLLNRSLYSSQLQSYLENARGHEHITASVFFNPKKAGIEKKYQRIMRLYKAGRELKLSQLPVTEFTFQEAPYLSSSYELLEEENQEKGTKKSRKSRK